MYYFGIRGPAQGEGKLGIYARSLRAEKGVGGGAGGGPTHWYLQLYRWGQRGGEKGQASLPGASALPTTDGQSLSHLRACLPASCYLHLTSGKDASTVEWPRGFEPLVYQASSLGFLLTEQE